MLKIMTKPAKNTGPSRDDRSGLREGEVAVELPAQFDASLYFIGRIRTPWKTRAECPKNGGETEEVCTIELDPRWTAGLQGLETVSHVLVLYWMDKARRDLVLQSPRHYAEQRGTFALRSPVRPNPIAAAVTRLKRIEGNKLFVVGLDCMDGTPLSISNPISPRPIPRPTPRSAGTLRASARAKSLQRSRSSILVEHDLFGKPASITGSSPVTGFFRIML